MRKLDRDKVSSCPPEPLVGGDQPSAQRRRAATGRLISPRRSMRLRAASASGSSSSGA